MNKFFKTIVLSIIVIIVASACGKKIDNTTNSNENINSFIKYENEGYDHGYASGEGDESGIYIKMWFNSKDKTDCVLVTAKLSDDETSTWEQIDITEENYDEEVEKFIASIPENEITVTSLNDQIPSDKEINKFVGKTLSDLENAGYEWSTDDEDEDGNHLSVYTNYDTSVSLGVYIEGGTPDLFELTDEEIAALKITDVKFWGFEG